MPIFVNLAGNWINVDSMDAVLVDGPGRSKILIRGDRWIGVNMTPNDVLAIIARAIQGGETP